MRDSVSVDAMHVKQASYMVGRRNSEQMRRKHANYKEQDALKAFEHAQGN